MALHAQAPMVLVHLRCGAVDAYSGQHRPLQGHSLAAKHPSMSTGADICLRTCFGVLQQVALPKNVVEIALARARENNMLARLQRSASATAPWCF